ncbi:MAG: adenylosuccinate lyase [Ruminococcaceae bacterium]|nr:adenylosuccinate lyase [Oscillospiraceae bacterium]
MSNHDSYISPFSTRYASREMQYLFSADKKFKTWRRLWIALAEAEQQAGLPITDEQIEEMKAHAEDIDYDKAAEYERKLRHDVMAHIHAWGDVCPKARPIIHLGATSCYVGDNTDMLILKEALLLVRGKLCRVMENLRKFALQYKGLPALGYTHLQPAQMVTVGKRATLWLYDLVLDFHDLEFVLSSLALLGSKGTTGTQASFMELLDGDGKRIDEIETFIAKKMGFSKVVPVSGQTYTRKFDSRVLNVLSGIAQSAYKFSNDMRILQSFKEMEEPFEKNQIGSSAMPYKRNPMRSERMGALCRAVISNVNNTAITAATQWFERTLDDSANRRISISEGFLATDAILNVFINVTDGLVVYPKVIAARIARELPFMASENILMAAVKRGGDRQTLHEAIREHAMAAGRMVKEEGLENDLLERIAKDPRFGLSKEEILAHLDPADYIGRSPEQVERFIKEEVDPILARTDAVGGAALEV